MALSNPITWNDMCAEFGLNPATAVFPRDFYGKGGAPGSGTLGFQDFVGRSGVGFNVAPGDYSAEGAESVDFAITCTKAAVWTWTKTAGTDSGATPASGGSNATWDGSCNSIQPPPGHTLDAVTQPNSVTFTVNANVGGVNYGPWHISLDCTGGGPAS